MYERGYVYLGMISVDEASNTYFIEQKNKFCVGDIVEVMKPDGRDIEVKVISIKDEEGNNMESCPHPKQKIFIDLGMELEAGDIIRMKSEEEQVNS